MQRSANACVIQADVQDRVTGWLHRGRVIIPSSVYAAWRDRTYLPDGLAFPFSRKDEEAMVKAG